MPFHTNQSGLGKRPWNLETSSAVVEFLPLYRYMRFKAFSTIKVKSIQFPIAAMTREFFSNSEISSNSVIFSGIHEMGIYWVQLTLQIILFCFIEVTMCLVKCVKMVLNVTLDMAGCMKI